MHEAHDDHADPGHDNGGGHRAAGHEAYVLYRRGVGLLDGGSPAAAAQVLTRAAHAEPSSRSVLEALGRAQYGAGLFADAVGTFARIVEASPVDDYAQFGLGLSASRTGDLRTAVQHLALADALRPGTPHYRRALYGARARLEAAG